MKSLIVYYIAIIVPFVLLIQGVKRELINMDWCLILFIFYAFIYRGIIDYYRLRSKNVISKKQYLIILIPGSRIKYFKELYFI